ncbi:MAG: type II secretion system protein GspL [Gammaproteobacteria bacterium]|uniref:type II secretion system protein GspL n=1 Tax=Shewanella sp. TaxID=50422 RepID=UPI001C737333|nr:type II secretion system protein GspL [Shewanella sp.]MBU1393403.1 type II secretion system protein GspL [Gammaproteobacteria bacterium]QYX64927.1 type II secretion system protein GspL [Shewanella putrefaciens]MBU1479576.1 type II secretion system protein GspL [Gammaproteobacteria bacterium]MBU2000765.1 type II secretion system protein GspL [Gammaproteobacteria bacterium]MBU2131288.1 type II secretion system protein GspL [Gammaproteobacteria bacterium]
MSERLFIRLGRTAEQACSWLVWSEQEQEIIASGELANAQGLSTLTERAGNRPVDVLVPAAAMTLTSVHLPEKGQRQALKALPFMLEEALAEDVDAMHFTVGPRDGDALSVVAVAHEQMQTWLSCLTEAGLKVKRIVPDCLALPLQECQWAAMNFGNELLLRTGLATGQSLPLPWLPIALEQLRPAQGEVSVASYTDMQLEGVELKPQSLELPMLVLARGILHAPVNLLSGVYTPKREYSKQLMMWKSAAIVIAIACVLALVNKGLTIHQVNGQIADLKAQSESIYQQVVPGNSRIVNLRSQMESQLRALQGQGSGAEFFAMLDGLQDAFKQVPELKPNSLRFESARNEIRMQVSAKNYAQIEKFKEIVGRRFQLDGGTMNSGEDQVTSTLTLRSK